MSKICKISSLPFVLSHMLLVSSPLSLTFHTEKKVKARQVAIALVNVLLGQGRV